MSQQLQIVVNGVTATESVGVGTTTYTAIIPDTNTVSQVWMDGVAIVPTGSGTPTDPFVYNLPADANTVSTITVDGVAVTPTGSGTATDPFVYDLSGSSDTNTVSQVTINGVAVTPTGTGTAADPFIYDIQNDIDYVSAVVVSSDATGDILTFTGTGNAFSGPITIPAAAGGTGEVGDTGNWTGNQAGKWNPIKNALGELVGFLAPDGTACPLPSVDGNHAFAGDGSITFDTADPTNQPTTGAPTADNTADTLSYCYANGTGRYNWDGAAWVFDSFKKSDVDYIVTEVAIAGDPPVNSTAPATAPSPIGADGHVHKDKYDACDQVFLTSDGGVNWCKLVIPKHGGCATESFGVGAALPTSLQVSGASRYDLDFATQAADPALDVTALMAGLSSDGLKNGSMIHVWNNGDGELTYVHPITGMTHIVDQGGSFCFEVCNGAFLLS